ncbi:MAG: hypothetical protein IJ227_05015 [Mogibacterium sp.]|nr:hypothetical protein [Mogibacterium sp.]
MAYDQYNSQRRTSQRNNDTVRFELMEHIGVLSEKDTGWKKEVNLVAWNGGAAKIDVREWDPEHRRMTKGITLREEEAEAMTRVLAERYGIGVPDIDMESGTTLAEEPEEGQTAEFVS